MMIQTIVPFAHLEHGATLVSLHAPLAWPVNILQMPQLLQLIMTARVIARFAPAASGVLHLPRVAHPVLRASI
jgi:hypothetical protein